jgi:hypothetical protein
MSRPGLTNERLTALFLLAVVLFTPPFLGIFNDPARILGVPTLYLYLFAVWATLIAVIAIVVERVDATADQGIDSDQDPRMEPGPPAQPE